MSPGDSCFAFPLPPPASVAQRQFRGALIRFGVLSARSRTQFFHGPGNNSVRIDLLKPRVDLAGEHADAVHGFVVFEKSRLSHDEKGAIATELVPMLLDLRKDLIGRA